MSVELWLGSEYEHTHEMRALGQFLSRMVELYGQDDNLYLILANFFCQGEEIDLAVLKRDGIMIVELKEADGTVVGRENGPWTVTKPDGSRWQINDKRRRNPFQQARAYRFAMIDQLKQDAPQFLPSQKARQMRLDHVAAVVTLCPTKHSETDIQTGRLKWFSVVGLDELSQEVYYQRSPALNFRKSELRKLAEVWGLRQYPLSHFVPGLAAGLPSVQGLKRVPAPHVAEAAVATQPPALMRLTSALAEWLGLEKVEAVEVPCVVCLYSPQPCQVPCLRGAIRCVLTGAKSQATVGQLEILQQDGEPVTLALLPPWTRLLPQVTKVLAQLESEGESRQLTLAAYHLAQQGDGKLVAGPDSLVILEPDWLINVTDLTKVEYCPRQYLTGRFQLIAPNAPLVRGTIVHRTFEQMVKTPHDEDAVVTSLKQAFFEQARNMAFLNHTKRSMWNEIKTHYDRLKRWVRTEQLPEAVRSETFLLTPQLGMKGKIDALWSGEEASLLVGELKTGRSYGGDPRPGHAFQVGAYSLMAIVRGWNQPASQQALVLYSGNEEFQGSLNVKRKVALTPEVFCDVVHHRNRLVLIDYLADAPFETEQPNKCWNCTIARECEETAVLLQHADPRPPELQDRFDLREQYGETERTWFRTYATLLAREYRAAKDSHAALWRMSPEQRCAEGTTVIVTGVSGEPEELDSGRYVYLLGADNRSELREEDYVLVSDANGPMRGRIAQGVIKRPHENGLEIEFSEPLEEFEPRFVDRYVSENLVERQFAGPYLWLRQPVEYRDLIICNRIPRFTQTQIPPNHPPVVGLQRLNARQQQAVQRALQMEDYLLIHGPPGSGKTMLIVAIVRELIHWGKRILLAAGTNTAVDNMLMFLKEAGFTDHILRLGSVNRTALAIRDYIPEVLAKHEDLDTYIQQLRHVLTTRPIVGATATTWLSGTWDGFLQFDVAIVDEAAQLTLPATLGPLRLARQFILIGDHKQLPAVVLSESQRRISEPEADGQPRLSESLFEQLYAHLEVTYPEGIVKLNEQYRMNEEICAIPRRMWYDEDLRPGTAKVSMARLALMKPLPRDHRLFAILDPECPVVFVDVPWAGGTEGPRTHRREAELVRDILSIYSECGLSMDSVGVIAPFRAQVATIRRVLEATFHEPVRHKIRGVVDTVDRFQGQERELIIISLATYGNFVHELLQDERRLNVALTRAKHKLIILGDVSVLGAHPTYYSLIRHCKVIQSKRL